MPRAKPCALGLLLFPANLNQTQKMENKETLSFYLSLPDGWSAIRFPFGVQLQREDCAHLRAFIPLPYEPQTRDAWRDMARQAIEQAYESRLTLSR